MHTTTKELLSKLKKVFEDPPKDISVETLGGRLSRILAETHAPNEQLFGVLRLAVTGRNLPQLHRNILAACCFLGPQEVLARLGTL